MAIHSTVVETKKKDSQGLKFSESSPIRANVVDRVATNPIMISAIKPKNTAE